jgi:tRNA (mo5U34)-methyltransferase
MKEKRVRLGGVELAAAMEAERAAKISRSPVWRYMVRRPAQMLGRMTGKNGHNGTAPVLQDPSSEYLGKAVPAAVASDPVAAELWDRVSKHYWYHLIDLGHGITTPGLIDNREQVRHSGIPADLTGKRCLDVGTFDGFWAFEMERRGAAEVVALDLESLADVDLLPQARQRWVEEMTRVRGTIKLGDTFNLAKEVLGSKVERKVLSVYELSPEVVGSFDVVYFGDIIVHLRDPQLAIQRVFSVTRGSALIASAFDPELDRLREPLMKVHASMGDFIWWVYSSLSLKAMMKMSGFDPVEQVSKYRVDNAAARFWKVVLKGHAPAS